MTTLPFPTAPQKDPGLVRLQDVHLTLGKNRVLQGIDLHVQRGEALTIIGPSGSGKSSLLRCINGLLAIDSGEIRVGDTAVHTLRHEAERIALRKRIGFVFQQYNLFPHLTVLENIMVAPVRILRQPRDQAKSRAMALLARVRLEDKAHNYPGELSGGQQQRVAIARALAMDPELVLFDEVTSALDPETVGEVLAVIRELVDDGMTCILVTHEMRFAREISDRVVFTEHGRVVDQGTPEQIFAHSDNLRTRAFIQALRA